MFLSTLVVPSLMGISRARKVNKGKFLTHGAIWWPTFALNLTFISSPYSDTALSEHPTTPTEGTTKIPMPHHYPLLGRGHGMLPLTPPQQLHHTPPQQQTSTQEHYYGTGNPMHVI